MLCFSLPIPLFTLTGASLYPQATRSHMPLSLFLFDLNWYHVCVRKLEIYLPVLFP